MNLVTDDAKGPTTAPLQSAKHLGVPPVSKKRKNGKENTCIEGSDNIQNVSPNSAMNVGSQKKLVRIVQRHSFTKQITGYSLKSLLAVKGTFCSSVGLPEACTITLKTSMERTRSWPVAFKAANAYGYINGPGWRRFCRDNKVKEGDLCTFNVIKTTVWHVVIVPS